MNILKVAVVGALFLQGAALPARAELGIDKQFGEISGWEIGFNESMGGCLAAAKYKDGTTVWLGFGGDENKTYIAFTNPKWQSIEADGGYEIQLVTGRRIWNGKFIGFERTNEKGVYSFGLKSEFVSESS